LHRETAWQQALPERDGCGRIGPMDEASAATAFSPSAPKRTRRAVAAWLLVCAALVGAMVVVGGITRLTHSGLSIAEWQPLLGTLPPLAEADWQAVFERYQQTPEYKLVNKGMSLAEFKGIFWWEYFHRLLGRAIGIVFLLPLLWFWWRGRIDARLGWKLAGVFVLGGLQGAMGWYMVASGLVDEPRVSHLRLTAHLGIAFLILGAMLWIAYDLLFPRRVGAARGAAGPVGLATVVAGLVFVQVLAGGLVAGIRAGKAYNTFPLMNGHLVPPETFVLEPWWLNFFNNMATVQLDHRLLAWVLLVLAPWLWWQVRRSGLPNRARRGADLLLGLVALQFGLGVATLLAVVPVGLAAAHQGVATLVFAAALFTAHALRPVR
jgi:cytochrome c oxidase assembly protein subunit 15